MAYNDGPLAAARREIAVRAAAHAARPADLLRKSGSGALAMGGGIPIVLPSCCPRTILMPSLRGSSTFHLRSGSSGRTRLPYLWSSFRGGARPTLFSRVRPGSRRLGERSAAPTQAQTEVFVQWGSIWGNRKSLTLTRLFILRPAIYWRDYI